MLETVGEARVAERQGPSRVTVKEYPAALVESESFRVEVTVKVSDVPWRELSVVTTLIVVPEIEIQLADGEIVKVSVYEQAESCSQVGTDHEYGPEPIV